MEEEQSMSRRYERSYVRLPVELVGISASGSFEQPGSVMDLSKGGLRVQSSRRLTRGQILQVFLRGVRKPYALCKVVWTRTSGGALPSDAGLEIQELPDVTANDAGQDFLDELRGVYHNPAMVS
jgi:PilZ domain